MDVERKGESHQIRLGEGENQKDVLRAIAVASFELARPAGLGRLHFNGGSTLRPEEADVYIMEEKEGLALAMDYVEGRQVKTYVHTQDDGNLVFHSRTFERDRGNPDPVFQRAKEILQNKHPSAALPTELTTTQNQFKDDSLTKRLQELEYERNLGETDEQFRGRIFPSLYRRDVLLAGEYVFGKHEAEWDDSKRLAYVVLIKSKPSDQMLQDFASNLLGELDNPEK